jgi:hypothetical protein
MHTEHDFMADLERLDSFFDGTEPGDIPLTVLRERGIEMPGDATLDDEEVHRRLWEVIVAMKGIGLVIESTDHLSDRELYRYLGEVLQEETILTDDPNSAWHLSPIGSGSEEDNESISATTPMRRIGDAGLKTVSPSRRKNRSPSTGIVCCRKRTNRQRHEGAPTRESCRDRHRERALIRLRQLLPSPRGEGYLTTSLARIINR